MKVRSQEYDSITVELSQQEFEWVTGIELGDKYGNGGLRNDYSEQNLQGEEFDLSWLNNAVKAIRCAYESGYKIKQRLDEIGESMLNIVWPAGPIQEMKDKSNK